MAHVLCMLPDTDFDPTEAAVPWVVLTEAGHRVTFATQSGRAATCDPVTLTGRELPWFASSLRARPPARAIYSQMAADPAFLAPLAWEQVDPAGYDALLLPGGHAPGMKPYLESPAVAAVARVMMATKPVAAICHGVLVLARATGTNGRSLLAGRRTTALTAMQEGVAVALTRWRLGRHYRTYAESVEEEVRAALGPTGHFERGPLRPGYATRDTPDAGFVVEDGDYLSARWPGDAWTLATRLARRLDEPARRDLAR